MKKMLNLGEKYYVHTSIFTLLLFFFYVFGTNNSFLYTSIIDYKNIKSDTFNGAVYPIEYVPNPFLLSYQERKQDYDIIESKYFSKIPKYDPEVFGTNPDTLKSSSQEYKNVVLSRVVYTIPYLSTYNFDYKEYTGSHPGVDIIVPKGTPIRNIANGVVVDVGYQPSGYGNYVVIRHDDVKLQSGKTTNLYSLYAHMDKISLKAGTKIAKGKYIGTAGESGTATTSHLHFQIDTEDASFHPFWPFTSSQMREAGVGFFDGVNIGLGKEQAIKSTINPLVFINNNLSAFIVEDIGSEENTSLASASETNASTGITQEDTNVQETNTSTGEELIDENQELSQDDDKTQEIVEETKTQETKTSLEEQIDLLSAPEENEILKNEEANILSSLVSNDNSSLIALDIKDDPASSNDSSGTISEDDPEQQLIKLLQSLEDEADSDELIKIFSDIPNDYEYYDAVKYFKDKGIIAGYDDNTFRPENNITRIESLKVILLSLGIEKIIDESSKFSDINTESWENTYVNAGVKAEIITTGNTNFYPQRQVNRVEALKMILTLAGIDLKNEEKDLDLKDVSETDWYYDYVNYAVKNKLVDVSDGYFYPSKALSREELVGILYKFVKK